MDYFPPRFVGPLSLEYDVTGRLAHLTAKIVDTATEAVIFNGVPTGLAEVEAGIYAADAFTYPPKASIYRRTWYDDLVLIKGSADEFQVIGGVAALVGGGRSSMGDLLARVRLLINDPSSATQQFSDAQLQQWLDENREDVRYLELTPEWQTSGSATQWFSFYDGVYGGHWESDAAFVSRAWSPVTPDTSDFLTGKWTWNASQFPPIFISGRTYDVYSAAADALEAWASTVALDFDVSTGRNNLSLSRSQKRAGLLEVAGQYRARGRTTSIPLTRSDT